MKKITKSMLTLALLLAGVQGANSKETVVFSADFSKLSSFEFFYAAPEGSSVELKDGSLVINNTKKQANNWDLQIDLAEDFPATAGLNYVIKIDYKTTTDGSISLGMGTLNGGVQYQDRVNWYGAPVKANEDFQTFVWNIQPYKNTNAVNHVIWQCGDLIATTYIKKIEVIEITPDAPEAGVIYGDLVEVTPTMYVKNYGEENGVSATPDADGIYTVTDKAGNALPWDAQFWIAAPNALPKGQKFKVEFDYKADNAESAGTQTHAATPGSYIIYHCIGNVAFTNEWQHFSKEQTIEDDMDGWQSIAFNVHCGNKVEENSDVYTGSNTTYYIKNIVLSLPEKVGETVKFTVGTVGWGSYSSNKAVALGSDNKGYAAKYDGSSVVLTPVEQVPANNAVLIEGAGIHEFDVISEATAITDNALLVSDGTITGSTGDIYVLADGTHGVGFYLLDASVTIPAGKAYLQVSAAVVTETAREFIAIGSDATAIKTIENLKKSGLIYNLSGQQVKNAKKGLYIIDGKKVMVK